MSADPKYQEGDRVQTRRPHPPRVGRIGDHEEDSWGNHYYLVLLDGDAEQGWPQATTRYHQAMIDPEGATR